MLWVLVPMERAGSALGDCQNKRRNKRVRPYLKGDKALSDPNARTTRNWATSFALLK